MKITSFSLKNGQFILVVVLLTIISGIYAFISMPKSEDPSLHLPMYYVACVYPGASAENMEQLVTKPLEEAISDIDAITKISSRSKNGITFIRLEGSFDQEAHKQYQAILRQVNATRSILPDGIEFLKVLDIRPPALLQLAITHKDENYSKMLAYANHIKGKLKEVPGLKNISILAEPEEEVRVNLDFEKLAQLDIPLSDIVSLLQSYNAIIPAGSISAGNKLFNINTSGGYKSIKEIENTVISSRNGKLTYLKDVATVNLDYTDQLHFGRFNKTPAIFVAVTPKFDQNIIQINKQLLSIIEKEKKHLSAGLKLETAFEQATAVTERIAVFFFNLLKGILIVGAIIFLFLGFRPSMIIMTIIPISIIMAIGALDIAGFGIHQISIVGLVIALGLLVDNAIVVIENIIFFKDKGYNLKEATLRGTNEVGPAIISSTATTVLAFYPLTQLGQAAGAFVESMPYIVIFALLASLLLALSFSPLLSSHFLKVEPTRKIKLQSFLDNFINTHYDKWLKYSLKKPTIVVGIATAFLFTSIALFPIVGVTFFPNADKPLLLIDIKTPSGSNVAETDKAVRYVEDLLDTAAYVKSYIANVGNGNTYIYYNREVAQFTPTTGQIVVNLNDWDPYKFYNLLGVLRTHFNKYPYATITTSELKNGPPMEAPITLKLLGNNLDSLKKQAIRLEKNIRSESGVINIVNARLDKLSELKVEINKDKAVLLGVLISDIDIAIRTCLNGFEVDKVNFENNKNYRLTLRMPFDEKPGIEDFQKIVVQSQSGENIPLLHLADVKFEESISEIVHFKGKRCATLMADVTDPGEIITTTLNILEKFNTEPLPEGMELSVLGELEGQLAAFGELYKSIVVAIIGIFSILVLQFKSFKQPLIIFAALPLAFTGSIFALWITSWSFSFFAFIGIISLIGIVVNDAIILVDYTNQLIEQGTEFKTAIIEAGKKRFTSIVLTSLTTILGLLPLALEQSGMWSPLAWTIIGGMVSCTFLTLLIVPLLFQQFSQDKIVVVEE